MRLVMICALSLFLVMPALAQQNTGTGFSTFHDNHGTSGTTYTYGNGFTGYQDSKGNSGTIYNYGNGFQSYQFTGPSGPTSGAVYTYPPMGTAPTAPVPPIGITPMVPLAPLAPMQPWGTMDR